MIKILMILSIAAMVVTGVFGWQNRQTFVDEREKKHSLNDQINAKKTDVLNLKKETEGRQDVLYGNREERNENKELLRSATNEFKNQTNKLGALEADVETKQQQLAVLQDKLDEFNKRLAAIPGLGSVKIDDIEPKYKELQKIVADGKEELAALGTEQVKLKEILDNKIKDREGHEAKQEKRKQQFERNTLNARVVEVSNDWGFLVINAGKNQEIAGDTQLMVVRPGMGGICKLSIIEVTETKTTANIVQNTMVAGVEVRVGDRVMVSTPRE